MWTFIKTKIGKKYEKNYFKKVKKNPEKFRDFIELGE